MMRKMFVVVSGLLMLVVAVQFFLAGRGTFTASFDAHRAVGFLTLLIALAALLLGALARAPKGTLGMMAGVVGLLVLQPLLAGLGIGLGESSATTGGLFFGLHAVNGVIILAMLGGTLRRIRLATTSDLGTRAEPGTPSARPQS
jgi:cytochrome b561